MRVIEISMKHMKTQDEDLKKEKWTNESNVG